MAAGDQSGCIALSRATTPETRGVDSDVPEYMAYLPAAWMPRGENAAKMHFEGLCEGDGKCLHGICRCSPPPQYNQKEKEFHVGEILR